MKKPYGLKKILLSCLWVGTVQLSFGEFPTTAASNVFISAGLGVVAAEDVNISGNVTDETGNSLPGVTIVIKGTAIGTITDIDGDYSLSVPDGDAVLVFSFIGYQSLEVPIDNR